MRVVGVVGAVRAVVVLEEREMDVHFDQFSCARLGAKCGLPFHDLHFSLLNGIV
jgi:hypothetical protein